MVFREVLVFEGSPVTEAAQHSPGLRAVIRVALNTVITRCGR